MNKLILEQFIDSDLSMIGKKSFPEPLKSIQNKIIKGNYVIQVNDVRDISIPLAEQIEDDSEETTHTVNSKSRTLRLECTDGEEKFFAMELVYCPSLSLDLSPGLKISIKDGLVRRGILMLTPDNIQILGGEVEKLKKIQKEKKNLLKTTKLESLQGK